MAAGLFRKLCVDMKWVAAVGRTADPNLKKDECQADGRPKRTKNGQIHRPFGSLELLSPPTRRPVQTIQNETGVETTEGSSERESSREPKQRKGATEQKKQRRKKALSQPAKTPKTPRAFFPGRTHFCLGQKRARPDRFRLVPSLGLHHQPPRQNPNQTQPLHSFPPSPLAARTLQGSLSIPPPHHPHSLPRPLAPHVRERFISSRRQPSPTRYHYSPRTDVPAGHATQPSRRRVQPSPAITAPSSTPSPGSQRDEGVLVVRHAGGSCDRSVGGRTARRALLRLPRVRVRRLRLPRARLRRRRILADARPYPRLLGGSSAPAISRRPSPQGPPPGRHGRGPRRSPAAPRGRGLRRQGGHRHLPGPGDDAAERGAGVHGGRDEPVLGRRRRLRDRWHPRAVRLVQLREPGGPAQVPAARARRLPPQRRPATPRRRDHFVRVLQLVPLPALRRRRHLRRPGRGHLPIAPPTTHRTALDSTYVRG